MIGRVVAVQEQYLGSVLQTALSGGESSVTVYSTVDFDEEGQLYFSDTGDVNTYTAIDDTTGVITLSGAVAAAHAADDVEVRIYPLSVERWATIKVGDNAADEEGVLARVPFALYDRIPVGIRDLDAGEGETVFFEFASDQLVITEVTGRAPVVDGSYIDPTTISTGSDGSVPSVSPDATVHDAFGALAVSWTPITNADIVTYEVYIDTATSPAGNPSNLVTTVTGGSSVFLRTTAAGAALTPGVTYYVQLVATDADGAAATPGAQDTGTPLDAGGTDGVAPTYSPNIDHVTPGYAFFALTWTGIVNADPVVYELHCSTSSGFTVGPTTFVQNVYATSVVTRALPNGAPYAYNTPYYFKLVAKDADGTASTAGAESTGTLVQLDGTGDILANSIAAASILADSITANEIATGTLTANEIMAGTITADRIATLTITAASGVVNDLTVDILTSGTLSATTTLSGSIKTAASGARVEVTSAGITGYDNTAVNHGGGTAVTFSLPTSGSPFFYGAARLTAVDMLGSALSGAGTNTIYWKYDTGSGTATTGYIQSYPGDVSGNSGQIFVTAAPLGSNAGRASLMTLDQQGGIQTSALDVLRTLKSTGSGVTYAGVLLRSVDGGSASPFGTSLASAPTEYGTTYNNAGAIWFEDGNATYYTVSGASKIGVLSSFLAFGDGTPRSAGANGTWGRLYGATLNSLQNRDGTDSTYLSLARGPMIEERYNRTDGEWASPQTIALMTMGSSMGYGYHTYDEFVTDPADSTLGVTTSASQGGWYANGTGGTAVKAADANDHPGIWTLGTAASATATAFVNWRVNPRFARGRIRMGAIVRVPTASALAQRFYAAMGFSDNRDVTAATNAILIQYCDNVNSGKWQGYCTDGTPATLDLGVTMTAGNWYFLELEVNSAGTSVEFFVNGASKGSISTHVPTASAATIPIVGITKTLGTTARTFDVDAAYIYGATATSRWT